MVESKGRECEKSNQSPGLKSTDDSYYLSNKWLGLGRHKWTQEIK